MWSLRQKTTGEFYLTYDHSRRFTFNLRGIWEWIGPQGASATAKSISANKQAGYLIANDDEGGVRVLLLEE